jgi:hypothetical protein
LACSSAKRAFWYSARCESASSLASASAGTRSNPVVVLRCRRRSGATLCSRAYPLLEALAVLRVELDAPAEQKEFALERAEAWHGGFRAHRSSGS